MNFITKLKPLTKNRKIFRKRAVAFLLLLSVVMTMPALVSLAGSTVTDTGVTGENKDVNTVTKKGPFDTYLKQCDIGLRIYVTDAYGNVQKTDKGYDAIDFLYEELKDIRGVSKSTGHNGNNYLRCTANPKGNYSIDYESIKDLGFENYEEVHTGSGCICNKEYFVDRFTHSIYGPGANHPIRQKLILTKAKSGDSIAEENVLKKYWTSVYNEYVARRENDNSTFETEKELYMHVEIVFGMIHHITDPSRPEWYGSVFEFGCHSDAENNKRIDYSKTYVSNHDGYWTYLPNSFRVEETFDCFKNFPYMQSAAYKNNLWAAEIESRAYGMYQIKFSDIIRIDIKTDKTEIPVSGDIEVKKEEATTISKVQNEDVEIRTGYAAQNGYYDIGVVSGIPTTEEIRNVIEAQDCIIDYAYVYEKYVPEKFPTVTYTFDYYVPCTCPEETHEEDDYGYDENGNYVVTGSHTVVDKPYGHHTDRS